jgi:hypothetical protein
MNSRLESRRYAGGEGNIGEISDAEALQEGSFTRHYGLGTQNPHAVAKAGGGVIKDSKLDNLSTSGSLPS